MKFRLFLISAVAVAIASCSNSHHSEDAVELCALGNAQEGTIHDVFSSVEVIKLEYGGEDYPRDAGDLRVEDCGVIVADSRGVVHVFGADGHYVASSSSAMGEGPEEFSMMLGYGWNPYSHCIEVLTSNSMMSYTPEFKYVSKSKLPTYLGKHSLTFTEAYALNETSYILLPSGISDNSDRLIFYDSEQEKQTGEVDYSDEYSCRLNLQPRKFWPMQDGRVMFTPMGMPYHADWFDAESGSLSTAVEFTMGSDALALSDLEDLGGGCQERGQYLLTCDKEILVRAMPLQDSFIAYSKRGQTTRQMTAYVANRTTGKAVKVDLFDSEGNRQFPLIADVDGEYAYVVMERDVLADSPHLLLDHDPEKILSGIDSESFVLLKYRIK